MNIVKLDWNQYHDLIDRLATKIHNRDLSEQECHRSGYQYIAGFETDDMVVAVHLSHTLDIPVITDINLLTLLSNFTSDIQEVLVVSNVVETGNTFQSIMEQTDSSFDTAVIFKDKNSNYKPTHYVRIPEEHVYFPWEKCGL
jgi:hypoxanthine phosphoribosyltransferase